MGRSAIPKKNAPENDLIMTPDYLARQIVEHFKPTGSFLDPAYGVGAFYEAVKGMVDKRDWCEITDNRDFFKYTKRVDWICTNPPYSILTPWLQHCFEVADDIVLLVQGTAPFFNARLNRMEEAGFGIKEFRRYQWPPEWINAKGERITFGTGLAAVHWQRGYTDGMMITDGREGVR